MKYINQHLKTLVFANNHDKLKPIMEVLKIDGETIEFEFGNAEIKSARIRLNKEQVKDLAKFLALWVVTKRS